MSFTDYLRLGELKIFRNVRQGLPGGPRKTTNLLTVKDSVLYAWDFADGCVLTLNVKAARSREGDNVSHQSLLPLLPVLFKPETLTVNDSGTLLIVSGPSGILVMELPARYPPYGGFDHNKEVVYCRSHSLDERLLMCNDSIEVRQVRFHPGSVKDSHILALTSDNNLRLYNVANSQAVSLATYQIGEKLGGMFPGTKTTYLAAFGEVAVDFDFGYPEVEPEKPAVPSLIKVESINQKKTADLLWPVYILRGDGSVYTINIPVEGKFKSPLKGPIPTNSPFGGPNEESCSIICLNTNPQVFCIANSNGTIFHSVLLPMDDHKYEELKQHSKRAPDKELLCFESVELELGLSTTDDENKYTCPIFLHKDESNLGRYFATHSAGIHAITITCLKDLHVYVTGTEDGTNLDDIFIQDSKPEYLVCTKTSTSEKCNPVVGFSLYYDPTSLIALLGDGNLVSLGILTGATLPKVDDLTGENQTQATSPLKSMLAEPFDHYIQKLLKQNSSQPILKLGSGGEHSQKECYELLQRASQVLREHYFENNHRARDEIEKRLKALQMLKSCQLSELERLNGEKHQLQETAEGLAEKYEDIKDRQDVIMKRCERLLILVSQKKAEPSDAEKEFLKELSQFSDKVDAYKRAIEKLKLKVKYQQLQIENWKAKDRRPATSLSDLHSNTIKTNLQEMSQKIAGMIKEVNEYKERLNLK